MNNSKGLEWFKKNLQVVIDGKDSKISELKAKIDVLESENRNLKSENRNLKSEIMNYEARVNCLITICVENGIILKDIS